MGFRKPSLPDFREEYEVLPARIWDIPQNELSERFAYISAFLSNAQRELAEERARFVVLKSKRDHLQRKEKFLIGGGKDVREWQATAKLHNNEEYQELVFDALQSEALCEVLDGLVKQYTAHVNALSREMTVRGDNIRGKIY